MLSTKAKEAASVAAQKAVELKNSTAEAVNDPNFLENMKSSAKQFGEKASSAAGQGWSSVNRMMNQNQGGVGTGSYNNMDGGGNDGGGGSYGGFDRFGRENSGGSGGFKPNESRGFTGFTQDEEPSSSSKKGGFGSVKGLSRESSSSSQRKAPAPAGSDWGNVSDDDDEDGWGSFAAKKPVASKPKTAKPSTVQTSKFANTISNADDDDDDGWGTVDMTSKSNATRNGSTNIKTSQPSVKGTNSARTKAKGTVVKTAAPVCNVDDDGWGNDFDSDGDNDGWVNSPVTSGRNTPVKKKA